MRKEDKVYLMKEHNCPKREAEGGGGRGGKRWTTDNEKLVDR
jgi:hypothetical protein